ncbi:hypothetical protein D3C84_1177040 [compost metagenome]
MVPLRLSTVEMAIRPRAMAIAASPCISKPSMAAMYGLAPTAMPAMVAHSAQA